MQDFFTAAHVRRQNQRTRQNQPTHQSHKAGDRLLSLLRDYEQITAACNQAAADLGKTVERTFRRDDDPTMSDDFQSVPGSSNGPTF